MSEDVKKRRHYRRTQLAICKLYVSRNETRWMEAKLEDISAGGAKFYLDNSVARIIFHKRNANCFIFQLPSKHHFNPTT